MKWNILVGSLVLGASLCTPSFAGGLLDKLLGLKGCGCDSTCCDTGCAADPSCGVENACGGCAADPSCGCESAPACGGGCGAAPSCGCESAPACGNGCGAPTCGVESACGAGPSCGCEVAPSCGCETSCCKPRRKPLLELLCAAKAKKDCLISKLKSHKCGCDTGCASACEPSCGIADPSCGCESTPACGSGCGAAPSCGCEIAAPSCDTGCGCGPKKCGLLSKLFKHKHKACCDSACDACPTAGCSSCGGSAPAPAAEAAPMPPAPVVDPSAYLQSNRRVIQATSYVR